MRNFFLVKHHPRGLTKVYQENSRQKRHLPDTRTIVQSLSNVQCRVVFWFFPLRRWRLNGGVTGESPCQHVFWLAGTFAESTPGLSGGAQRSLMKPLINVPFCP